LLLNEIAKLQTFHDLKTKNRVHLSSIAEAQKNAVYCIKWGLFCLYVCVPEFPLFETSQTRDLHQPSGTQADSVRAFVEFSVLGTRSRNDSFFARTYSRTGLKLP